MKSLRAVRFSQKSGITTSSFKPVDGQFKVVPVNVNLPPPESKPAPVTPDAGFTEEDCMMITDVLCQIPVLIKPKIPVRTKEEMQPFNHQFYAYCIRKKINPFDHYFDEMGMMMAGIGLFGGIWQDYEKLYKNGEKKIDPLNKEYEHEKKLAEEKEKVIT